MTFFDFCKNFAAGCPLSVEFEARGRQWNFSITNGALGGAWLQRTGGPTARQATFSIFHGTGDDVWVRQPFTAFNDGVGGWGTPWTNADHLDTTEKLLSPPFVDVHGSLHATVQLLVRTLT